MRKSPLVELRGFELIILNDYIILYFIIMRLVPYELIFLPRSYKAKR